MVDITVDGKMYQVDEAKNLIDALKYVQIEVPYFCYHPKLSVVGMCRICLIEIEGVPKLQPACNTPVREGMKIRVASEKSIKAREGVMEFLLVNHPLDCPVCDKAGECQLQDYSFTVGGDTTRYKEVKRNIPQESIGSNLLINHNRCILCYRCVRFDSEVMGVHDLEFAERGNNTVIAYTPPSDTNAKELDHNYQGALADICPVGALLNKNTLFTSRVWWFEQNQSICHGCSQLCSITANYKRNELYRYMPPEKPDENGYFICDQGRFSCSDFSKNRLSQYYAKNEPSISTSVIPEVQKKIIKSKNILWLGGTIDSNEEIDELISIKSQIKEKGKNIEWEYRTEDYMWQNKWDDQIDFLYMRDQRPNSRKCRDEHLGFFGDEHKMKESLENFDLIFIFNEFSSPYAYLSNDTDNLKSNRLYQLIEEKKMWDKVVLFCTHEHTLCQKALFTIPIQAFPEKNAHFTRHDGRVKKASQSIKPPEGLLDTTNIMKRIFVALIPSLIDSLVIEESKNSNVILEESGLIKV